MSPVVEYFLYPISPILSIVAAGLGLITAECFPSFKGKTFKYLIAVAGTLGSLAFLFCMWTGWPIAFANLGDVQGVSNVAWLAEFTHSFRLDKTILLFFAGISVFTLLSLTLMHSYYHDKEERAEVLILTLFVASGMMLLVSANSLLMVFLALELLSLPTYVLVGIQRKDRYACEAALKYFLFGSFATVLLVMGIALLYAHFGTLEIPRIAAAMNAHTLELPLPKILVLAGMALLIVAVGFKVGIVPFHMWVPDTYQGAPTPVTAFMGSAVKLAGFGLAMRLFWDIFRPIADQWSVLLCWLAVITMFVGNLAAITQDNLKRMFAYSSIAHAGYLLLAVASIPKHGPNPTFLYYYLMIYGLMFIGMFAILTLIEYHSKNTDIFQLSGLGFTHPVLGVCIATFVLSAAGIPPTAGFLAKYFVFMEAVRAGHTGFVVAAVISSIIGAYYYLRVVVYLYMKESRSALVMPANSKLVFVCIGVCALAMLVFAISPSSLGLAP